MATLAEMRTAVAVAIEDQHMTKRTAAQIDAEINRIYRNVSKKEDMVQGTIVFRLPSADVDFSLVSWTMTDANKPVVASSHVALGAWPSYKISNAIRVLSLRYDKENDDGTKTEILPVSTPEIDNQGLLRTGGERFTHYTIPAANDIRLQLFPRVSASQYAIDLMLEYVFWPVPLVGDDDVPDFPLIYHDLIISQTARYFEGDLGRPVRERSKRDRFREELNDAKEDKNKKGKSTPMRIGRTRGRIC